ncbi:hypothetical protein GTO89_10095 [Heliobacterium gestii]|uniref:Copper amine oxidase-like N-terminal domain-containing protein n=1 Tax=Heliomicrobium gestii TaxID=2699 RepID=A0A845LCV5_HELGE|nr:copper amine oxidase N-terminal domain-containing protein [Heliomicrobium gestii]MBM7868193.1 hypothetical protein [Heliomicrobium gestii]MZP43391.1 hypothetical protein [Heliomicrobium gestii]
MNASTDDLLIRFPADTIVSDVYAYAPPSIENSDNQIADVTWMKKVNPNSNSYVFSVQRNTASPGKGFFYIDFQGIRIPSYQKGDFPAYMEASPNSVFSTEQLPLATISSGKVTLSVDEVASISSDSAALSTIRIREESPGDLKIATDSIELKLPPGFKWKLNGTATNETLWGDLALGSLTTENNDQTLKIGIKLKSGVTLVPGSKPKASTIELSNLLIEVDEQVAQAGDVNVTFDGQSDVTASSMVIARYGGYSLKGGPYGDIPTIIAGRRDQPIAVFFGEELAPGTIDVNRSITATVPKYVKWNRVPVLDTAISELGDEIQMQRFGTSGTDLFYKDDDGSKINGRFTKKTQKRAAKVYFKKGTVDVAPNFKGLLALEFGGTSPMHGKMPIAKVVPPVAMQALKPLEIVAGVKNQKLDDIIIAETLPGALLAKQLRIYAPKGITFEQPPGFEVVEGNLVLAKNSVNVSDQNDNGDPYVSVDVENSSSVASKIKLSNLVVNADGSVPDGTLVFEIKGWDTATSEITQGDFSESKAAETVVANVYRSSTTPKTLQALFTIGQANAQFAGSEVTLGAAPYIKEGRTYLPLRDAAKAVGIADADILWDPATQQATLSKGAKFVQIQMDSTTLRVNGTEMTMDTPPEVVDPGRIMVPVRWIANAFNANTQWDEATQTVTITAK